MCDGQVGILCKNLNNVSATVRGWGEGERLRCARSCRAKANARLRDGEPQEALPLYRTALHHINASDPTSVSRELELSCHLNLALASLRLDDPASVLHHCDQALGLRHGSAEQQAKAHFRRGQALSLLGRLEEALASLCKANTFCPEDPLIARELAALERKRVNSRQRAVCARMLEGM
eukprot:NODE_2929_length_844_cov_81.691824_g2426_i0.p3 GENE.NODE_2929_length_844_cov_81.691824_g2426_i0~~NODE_2929_length_844_cov_81.691824_g2426_i0.p3  ORF type:complete len:178 (-),score=35.26 NODE_2929_length_844_cov_81.691824_g2426_i0:3-536(-)